MSVAWDVERDGGRIGEAFHRDGYVVLPNFFEPELMAELDGLCRQHYGDAPAFAHDDEFVAGAQVEVVPWFPQRQGVSAFGQVEDDPRVRKLTTVLLGEGWRSDYCMAMHSRAESPGQAWHQDCPAVDPTQFNLNRLVYTHPVGGARGGGLVVVPGSHRRGHLPAGEPRQPLPGQVVIDADVGTLVLVHGHCWHAVLPVGPEVRISLNYRALPSGARDGLTDVCVYRNMHYRFSTAEVLVQRQS